MGIIRVFTDTVKRLSATRLSIPNIPNHRHTATSEANEVVVSSHIVTSPMNVDQSSKECEWYSQSAGPCKHAGRPAVSAVVRAPFQGVDVQSDIPSPIRLCTQQSTFYRSSSSSSPLSCFTTVPARTSLHTLQTTLIGLLPAGLHSSNKNYTELSTIQDYDSDKAS